MVIHETLVLFVVLLTKRTRESNACHRELPLISEKLPRKVQGLKALIPQYCQESCGGKEKNMLHLNSHIQLLNKQVYSSVWGIFFAKCFSISAHLNYGVFAE
jgi:hypothetical protein